MSVPSAKTRVTCDNPKREMERNSSSPGSPAIAVSMGKVISFSISSAASASTVVLIWTWTLVISGTASIGSREADQAPSAMRAAVAVRMNVRWRSENSRMRLIMVIQPAPPRSPAAASVQ